MIEFEISTNKKQIDFDITQGIPKYTPANFQSKTVIPTTEQQIIRADKPYDGLEQVTVEPIKVLDKTITQNGTYNAESDNLNGYSSVEVNVQPTLQEKSITITENGTTEVVADSGYDGLAKVSVEANVKDNSLLNVIKGLNSYYTTNYPFELTADMWDENSKSINQYKYQENKNITKVIIPNNIIKIGKYAFFSCSNLTSVIIPDSVTNIGEYAFSTCSSLTSITIPNSVTNIEGYAFEYCYNLTRVDITDITKWCVISFYNNTANPLNIAHKLYLNGELVIDLVIPDSVMSIGNYAFYNCRSLTSITIGNSVKSIGNYAFYYCNSLTSITISDSVTNIGNSAFYYCSKLEKVDFRNSTAIPTVQSNSFGSVPKTCKFIIPDELYDSWIASTNWVSLYNNGYQFIKASEYTEA